MKNKLFCKNLKEKKRRGANFLVRAYRHDAFPTDRGQTGWPASQEPLPLNPKTWSASSSSFSSSSVTFLKLRSSLFKSLRRAPSPLLFSWKSFPWVPGRALSCLLFCIIVVQGVPGSRFFVFYLPQLACLLSARGVKSKFEVRLLGEQTSSSPSFRPAFAPRGIPSPEFRACCSGTKSSLAFRPAFLPGRITSTEFRAFCKHGSSIVACFPAGISSRKNHSSGIPSFVQARELHLRLFFGLHFLQEESHLRNSKLLQARELHLRLFFGRHFLQAESHLRNSKLSASTGAPSPLAFRPAFPPGSITSPEFKTYCKHGNFVPASGFVRKP